MVYQSNWLRSVDTQCGFPHFVRQAHYLIALWCSGQACKFKHKALDHKAKVWEIPCDPGSNPGRAIKYKMILKENNVLRIKPRNL